MASLRQYFSRYTGLLRQFKLVYILNNLLNRQQLIHNKDLYKKYGLQKSIYRPLGKKDFQEGHPDIPWLDRPGAEEALAKHPQFQSFSSEWQQAILTFVKEGYLILPQFFKEEAVDQLNQEIDDLLERGQINYNYTGKKIVESFRVSPIADQQFFRSSKLVALLNFIMGKPVIPFQTINFIEGSEQRAHSDSIHMTTQPFGYLIAVWIALEDIEPGCGELFYYPGSHRLPFVSTSNYDSGNTRWTIGANSNQRYEDKIEKVVASQALEKNVFLPKKGDLLIWHANLLHGGSPITRPGSTRKSMVAHYFCEEVICYHEISQRPALL